MTCQELVEAITDYLEGTMSWDERRRFDAHLAECPYCVRYLEQMRSTLAAVGQIRVDSVSPALRDRLLEAFRGLYEREV